MEQTTCFFRCLMMKMKISDLYYFFIAKTNYFYLFFVMNDEFDGSSFFRKPKRSTTGLVQWCGDSTMQYEPLQFSRTSQREGKISMKGITKKKQGVKKTVPPPEHRQTTNKQITKILVPQSHPMVRFSYPSPKILQVQEIPHKPHATASQQGQKMEMNMKPQKEIPKDRPYLSFVSPPSLNMKFTSNKSQRNLSEAKPTDRTKHQEQLGSQIGTRVNMGLSIISLEEKQQEVRSTEQTLQENGKKNEKRQDKSQKDSDEKDDTEEADTMKPQQTVLCKNTIRGTSFGMKCSNELVRGDFNKLQRRKYEKGKLFSNIRRIQTMLSQDDGQSEEWSKVSQVIENFQGLLAKVKENHHQDYTFDTIIPK